MDELKCIKILKDFICFICFSPLGLFVRSDIEIRELNVGSDGLFVKEVIEDVPLNVRAGVEEV